MRIACGRGWFEANEVQKLADAREAAPSIAHAMHDERLLERLGDREAGVERGERVLEDELQVPSPAAHFRLSPDFSPGRWDWCGAGLRGGREPVPGSLRVCLGTRQACWMVAGLAGIDGDDGRVRRRHG